MKCEQSSRTEELQNTARQNVNKPKDIIKRCIKSEKPSDKRPCFCEQRQDIMENKRAKRRV